MEAVKQSDHETAAAWSGLRLQRTPQSPLAYPTSCPGNGSEPHDDDNNNKGNSRSSNRSIRRRRGSGSGGGSRGCSGSPSGK